MQAYQPLAYPNDLNRDPPPYPNLKSYYQPGYRQSYSGSETSTDFSQSSSENLSVSARQDPQGEETSDAAYQRLELGIIDPTQGYLSQLAVPTAVEVKTTHQGTFYVTGNMQQQQEQARVMATQEYVLNNEMSQWNKANMEHLANQQRLANIRKTNKIEHVYRQCSCTSPEHTCQMALVQQRRPPPEYPQQQSLQYTMSERKELRRSYEMLDKLQLTRSQPDLTQFFKYQSQPINFQLSDTQASMPHYSPNLPKRNIKEVNIDHAAIASRASSMVEMLSEENKSLRALLDEYYRKVSKLQKLESELKAVNDAHESFVSKVQKRENLEKAMRYKLEHELKKQKESNKSLKEQLQKAFAQTTARDVEPPTLTVSDTEAKSEIQRKDKIIAKKKKVPTATLR